jgi:hypothetical protein
MRIEPTSNFGYHIKFVNGATVSVQFGYGNYCENRHDFLCSKSDDTSKFTGEFETAEIAAWDETGEMFQLSSGDTVLGWQTPEQVEAFTLKTAAMNLDAAHYMSRWGSHMAEAKQYKIWAEERREAVVNRCKPVREALLRALEQMDALEACTLMFDDAENAATGVATAIAAAMAEVKQWERWGDKGCPSSDSSMSVSHQSRRKEAARKATRAREIAKQKG